MPSEGGVRRGLILMAVDRANKDYYRRRNLTEYRQNYVYGSAVPLPDYQPVPEREVGRRQRRRVNPQVRKNRQKAQSLSGRYVFYLLLTFAVVVAVCVFYLQLQAENFERANQVASLRNQLESITEQNNTAYQNISRSVDLEMVRLRAINEFGMVNKMDEHVITYQNPSHRYVILHNEIPVAGVITR